MDWKKHLYRVGSNEFFGDDLPSGASEKASFEKNARKHIEPWLSAVFQSEHLSLFIGSGLTAGVASIAGSRATGMGEVKFGTRYDSQIGAYAKAAADRSHRGSPNIEDQIRAALALLEGAQVMQSAEADSIRNAINAQLGKFFLSLLATERGISGSGAEKRTTAERYLVSFLLSFASRVASRDRLSIFTTNYDRLIEYGCDLAGVRIIDRFVGSLWPIFRSSRLEIDLHYNPPGIRGEPRYLEGVVRLTKLHGSIDWHLDRDAHVLRKIGIPFGAADNHSDVPSDPLYTAIIYPNPAKDIETTEYPYAELFRDFASAVCRPNSVVVVYGYSFGDDHVSRVLDDMLTIPSTHLVIIAYSDEGNRIRTFCEKSGRVAQTSLLVGSHFGDLATLVDYYLPKPAIDYITSRQTEILKKRGQTDAPDISDQDASAGAPLPRAESPPSEAPLG
jgi:SIR2-like domain